MKKLASLIIVLVAFTLPVSAQNIVSIGNYSVDSSGNLRVPIYLNYSIDAGSVGIELNYNPAFVRAYSDQTIDKGDFTDFYGPDNSHNASGYITINTYKTAPGLNGNVTIGYVRLQAVGSPGSSSLLNLSILTLTDSNSNDIAGHTVNGSCTISLVPSVLTSIVVSPSSATLAVGETLTFNATALNDTIPMAGVNISFTRATHTLPTNKI